MVDAFDTVVSGGTVFDGRGGPGLRADVGIKDGRVVSISEAPLPVDAGTTRIDATGRWVTPGFIDFHTHYDAEVELAPGLVESVRHGVTTVSMGSCSLGLVAGHARGPGGHVLPGRGHSLRPGPCAARGTQGLGHASGLSRTIWGSCRSDRT